MLLCHELISHFVRVSVVGMGIRLPVGRWGVRIPVRAKCIFLFSNHVQTGRVAHPVSYSMGTGVLPSLPAYSPDVKKWSCTFNVPTRIHGLDRETFTFFFKLYHIHVNKLATKLYNWPNCVFLACDMIQYLQTNITINRFLQPSESTRQVDALS